MTENVKRSRMRGWFEFDIDEWVKERDEAAAPFIAKLDTSRKDYDEVVEEILHIANGHKFERLCIDHYIFAKRRQLFFGRPDVQDLDVLRAAAIDARGLTPEEAGRYRTGELILMLRGEISRTFLPEDVVSDLENDKRIETRPFARQLVRAAHGPAPRVRR